MIMAIRKNLCDLILLSRYADQETNPEETRQIQAHLLSCPECRQALAEQRQLAELLQQGVSAAQQGVDFDRLEKRILTVDRRRSRIWSDIREGVLSWKVALPVATAAAALILFFFTPLFQQPSPSGPSAIINSFTGRVTSVMILETPRSQQTVIWYSEESPTDHASENAQKI
ncbi:MAG: zf-HC2 domain-containing protein [Desulfobacterales bacterium]|nr:MAG: zf-HC2 domain-containing protein [Desulfobacterales bacterium]